MFSELIPMKYRGRGMLILNFSASFGKLFGIFLAYLFIPDLTTGNWRMMIIISSALPFGALVLIMLTMDESVRFLLSIKKFEAAKEIINSMIDANNRKSNAI